MTDDDAKEGGGSAPPPEDVPPPNIIKIDDFADTSSPYVNLDGATLAKPDGVAVARLDAQLISNLDGDGVLLGRSMADMAYVIGGLGKCSEPVRVRELAFRKSADIAFVTSEGIEATLHGDDNAARRGARRLLAALSSPDTQTLLKVLGGIDDSLASRLEDLLKLLHESKATLDVQAAGTDPVRVVPQRAFALFGALRSSTVLDPRSLPVTGRLVGAIADTRDFKIRLHDAWRGRRVIEGKFVDGLQTEMETLWNQEVLATVEFEEQIRGVRGSTFRFTLREVQAVPRLPFRR